MELMDNALSSTLLILANQNPKMSRLWYFCTIVLLLHQYVHICSASSSSFSSSFTAHLFENWRQEHGKTYSSEQEKQYRLRVLEDNYDYITQHNDKANSTYTLSLNAFADLTHHEFKAKYLLGRSLSASTNDLDSSTLLEAVAVAKPVSVGICGSDRSFQFYSQGIFTGPCCDTLDHIVLIVGYDSRNGIEYWNVKNSWGTSWGINGYMHLERKNGNSCGMNKEIIRYPLKETSPSPNPLSPTFVKCDALTHCNDGETCCCGTPVGKLCIIIWKCCPGISATCCKDRIHCCNPEFPICVGNTGLCRKKNGDTTLANQLRNATLQG